MGKTKKKRGKYRKVPMSRPRGLANKGLEKDLKDYYEESPRLRALVTSKAAQLKILNDESIPSYTKMQMFNQLAPKVASQLGKFRGEQMLDIDGRDDGQDSAQQKALKVLVKQMKRTPENVSPMLQIVSDAQASTSGLGTITKAQISDHAKKSARDATRNMLKKLHSDDDWLIFKKDEVDSDADSDYEYYHGKPKGKKGKGKQAYGAKKGKGKKN